jgi:methylmalonyl-CoA/ethylmalonyl-CoA epimerase
MTELRRLDHVAIAVRDTAEALEYFSGRLGLPVASSEILEQPHVRLTYLDCANAFIQLVEPLDPSEPLAHSLDVDGEGFRHICFGVEDVAETAARLADLGAPAVVLGHGRGRQSAFVPGPAHHGAQIECTVIDDSQRAEMRNDD